MPAQGGKPLKEQFTDLVLRQRTTQDGQPVFLLGTGVVSGGSYAEARRAALLRARVNIVAQMESEVRSLVEIASERGSLSGQEASEALAAVSSSKVTVRERLGNTEEVVGIYRDTPTGVEVRITLAYSFDQACDDLKNAASESVAIQKLLNEKH